MSDAVDLLAFLGQLGGVDLALRRSDGTLAVAAVNLADGRQLIAIGRTYRAGGCVILDPTEEEMAVARDGNLWQLWTSDRAEHISDLQTMLEPIA